MLNVMISIFSAIAMASSSNVEDLSRNEIRVVGSSTVYPFITEIAEHFGHNTNYRTPIIESTGTGGGFKLFCSGLGADYPDISNASRHIKDSEVKRCAEHGITDILEISLGFDGIVLAQSNDTDLISLTKQEVFNALAKDVVVDGKLVENPYVKWSDINPSLPNVDIAVYGPPPTSGTRDAFVELVLEPVCVKEPAFIAKYPEKKIRKKYCHLMREDNHFLEAGENDNLIIQKLGNNKDAFGIFGYSFLQQNTDKVHGVIIDGSAPSTENIANGSYSISRPLLIYIKLQHLKVAKGLGEFILEATSDEALSRKGYLVSGGLIALSPEKLEKQRAKVNEVLK